jgi:hypothetical protein
MNILRAHGLAHEHVLFGKVDGRGGIRIEIRIADYRLLRRASNTMFLIEQLAKLRLMTSFHLLTSFCD